jgi:hypothetical protein
MFFSIHCVFSFIKNCPLTFAFMLAAILAYHPPRRFVVPGRVGDFVAAA